ncbi:MAG: dTMP kinase [Capsulimonadales bacterium]|nr:dTMP kinase [Capsulimonadales bacterium]
MSGQGLQGLFLTFEGPDGAGKTTQIGLLAEVLTEAGYPVARTREPGGDGIGERVRELLLHGQPCPEAELLLFAAARAQNVREVIRPALAEGKIVLCDRFTDSTVAYQGYGRGLSLDLIYRVNHFATGGLVPDRTYLFDLEAGLGLARRGAEETNRLDRETLDFHERVREGFLKCAVATPARITVIPAEGTVTEVARLLRQDVLRLVESRKRSETP